MSGSHPRAKLPRLPIPDLRKTMDRYLESIQPVLLADEHAGGPSFSTSYARQQALVSAFLASPGPLAQARLLALDKASPHNWLDDNFWMKKTYLEWRAPLLINSNWWLTFVNDPDVPEEVVTDEGEGFTPWQVRRAACLVHGIVDFKHRMQSRELFVDTSRTGTWLRRATSLIFNVSRIPQLACDKLTVPSPTSSPWASTVTVLARDFYYALRVADPTTGVPLHVDDIERGLRAVVTDVLRRRQKGHMAVEVGVLSSDGRDEWTENYDNLVSLSPQNARSFEAIHQSLFVLSLDHWSAPSVPANRPVEKPPLTFEIDGRTRTPPSVPQPPSSSPTIPSDLQSHQYAIRSSPSALNRFFDKPLSLIVERTTRAGAMGEHSVVDALVPSVVCEWGVAGESGAKVRGGLAGVPFEIDTDEEGRGGPGGLEASTGACWTRLDFATSPSIQTAIENVKRRAEALLVNSDHDVLHFEEWGGEEAKRVSSNQPDPFVQLALQLAYYRLHSRPTPVYETALTRAFHHGRTETIRSFTMESYAFLRACAGWKGGSKEWSEPPPHLHSLLQSAFKAHSFLTRAAMTGRGIDRHLLGLRCVLSEEWASLDNATSSDTNVYRMAQSDSAENFNTNVPLFEDPIFKRTQEWRLSTSGLSEGWWFRGTGFGSPYEDGYGINYLIRPNSFKFCVESKHSCPITSTRAFLDHIVDALRDIRDICLWARKREEEASLACSSSEVTTSEGKSAEQAVTGSSRCKSGHAEGSILAKARL
ncbi:acyltransferase ChoActase/COT/CPT [Paxillus ammoniavirescens]|nr:acyltransferase ChoActase/COT/CPT [Paxillus ammoniavirescens]